MSSMGHNHSLERINYNQEKDKLQVYIHKKRYQLVEKYLKLGTVLDIGCGLGWGANYLSIPSNEVIGIDIDGDAVKLAKSSFGIPSFLQADSVKLPFKDQCFDTVSAIEVIEHLDHQSSFMKEVIRVLKPYGILILSTPNNMNLLARIAKLFRLSIQENPYHIRGFDHKSLIAFLNSYDLEIINISGIYLPFIPLGGKRLQRFVDLTKSHRVLVDAGSIAASFARFSFVVCRKR